jgi:hypothetical protein
MPDDRSPRVSHIPDAQRRDCSLALVVLRGRRCALPPQSSRWESDALSLEGVATRIVSLKRLCSTASSANTLATFLVEAQDRYPSGEVPGFIRAEFDRSLRCGLLCHGFARVRCSICQDELLVAFSCKNRGLCPSCAGRWMSDSAAHLRDHVFPAVPVRQWVLTLPMRRQRTFYTLPTDVTVPRATAAWQSSVAVAILTPGAEKLPTPSRSGHYLGGGLHERPGRTSN